MLDKIPVKYKTITGSVVFGLVILCDAIFTHFQIFAGSHVVPIILNTLLSASGSLAGLGLLHKLKKSDPNSGVKNE